MRGVACDADNASLRTLGEALGNASATGIRPGDRNAEQHGVNRVEAMEAPRLDPAGNVILSTSAQDFPLHTDDTFTPEPVRYVLMHCWQADPSGAGVSELAHVDDLLPQLPTAMQEVLRTGQFAAPYGSGPVLFDTPDVSTAQAASTIGIRFNHRDFLGYAQRFGPPLGTAQHAALEAVLAAARASTQRLLLARGDCLVVDNHKVLHGRTAFNARSGRLLKRLRVAVPSCAVLPTPPQSQSP